MPLRVHSELPAGLLDLQATELHRALGGPSLIKLAGQSPAALFVSVLLHEFGHCFGCRFVGGRRGTDG